MVFVVADASISRNYSYLYFEHGYPQLTGYVRRPTSHNVYNIQARNEPNIIIQTGNYSVRLDCDTLELSGFDALEGSDYVTALTEDVTEFSTAQLSLTAVVGGDEVTNGVAYTATSAKIQEVLNNAGHHYVRFIEGGQYVQRMDLIRVEFTPDDPESGLPSFFGRLEVTAWPDHLALTLDVSDSDVDVTMSSVSVTTPSGKVIETTSSVDQTTCVVAPHLNSAYSQLDDELYMVSAVDSSNTTLSTSWDTQLAAIKVQLDEPSQSGYVDRVNKDNVYEVEFTVTNPTDQAVNLPLFFNNRHTSAITGTMNLLCDMEGRPLGIPVQLSKNWHVNASAGSVVHQGYWIRNYTMIPLAAGVTKSFKLRQVYGYWGDGSVATASHSSLALPGWSTSVLWKWDEAALGAWGEAMTFDISQHAAGSVVADIRPTFTTPMNGNNSHHWTENIGGSDFLNYYDRSHSALVHSHVMGKKLKTCYRWAGPNMTEVLYSGMTADDKIRFTYTTRGVATMDYHRRFNGWKYEFLEDVVSPRRFVFYQLAADFYFSTDASFYHYGDKNGLISSHAVSLPEPADNQSYYYGAPFQLNDRWLNIDHTTDNDSVYANRGVILTKSTLNGNALDTYVHPYKRTWGSSELLYDITGETTTGSYEAGDVIEGEVAFILSPKNSDSYWGTDAEFISRLGQFSETWEALYDEARYNNAMSVVATHGTLARNYPIEIEAAEGDVLMEVDISGGGIGHVPVVLKEVPLGTKLTIERFDGSEWSTLPDVTVEEHAYYQGYYNNKGRMDYVFSIPRPTTGLADTWGVRVSGEISHYDAWVAQYPGIHYRDAYADQDGDGNAILVEYVLDGNPFSPEVDRLPVAVVGEQSIALVFDRLVASDAETTQKLQWTSDLTIESWEEVALTGEVSASVQVEAVDEEKEQVTVTIDQSLLQNNQLFWRLAIEKQD